MKENNEFGDDFFSSSEEGTDVGADFFSNDSVNEDAFADSVGSVDEGTEGGKKVGNDGKKGKKGKVVKSSKAPKQKKEKSVKGKGAKKSKKSLLIVVIVLVAVVGGIIAYRSMGSGDNFYDVAGRVFRNDNGHFRYVVDVRKTAGSSSSSINLDDLSDSNEQDTEGGGSNSEAPSKGFTDWTSSDGSIAGSTAIENYTVTIDGYTMSGDAYDSEYTISIATDNHNGEFTTITSVGGKLYVNMEKMYTWMRSSGNGYFVRLANEMPVGAKYYICDQNSLDIVSGHAEAGESSHVSSYEHGVLRFKYLFESIINMLGSYTSYAGCGMNNDTLTLSLSGEKADKFAAVVSSFVRDRGDIYDTLISGYSSNGLCSEGDMTQLQLERDNFIKAGESLHAKMEEDSPSNVVVSGKAMDYTDADGIRNIEASLSTQYFWGGNTYTIALSAIATSERPADGITAPKGEDIGISKDVVWGTLRKVADYMNISGFKLNQSATLSVENIRGTLLQGFVSYINDNSDAGINELNAKEFIQKYAQFPVTESTTEKDKRNAELVQNFIAGIVDITGTIAVKAYVAEGVDLYPVVDTQLFGVHCRGEFADDEYDTLTKTAVVKFTIPQTEENCNTANFSIHTLSGSVYALDSVGGVGDTIDLSASESTVLELRFIMENGVEACDLYYGDTRLGTLVNSSASVSSSVDSGSSEDTDGSGSTE